MRITICFLILALLVSSPASAMEPGSFEFEQIPTFDEPNPETLGLAFAINESGEIVGIAEDEQFRGLGFLYRLGVLGEVSGFDADTHASPRLINGFGDLAGFAGKNVVFSGVPGVVDMPFLRREGEPMRNLLTDDEIDAAVGGSVLAFNDLGSAVFSASEPQVAFPDGERMSLANAFPHHGLAVVGALNNRNQLVGARSPNGGGGLEAFLLTLDDFSVVDLHDPSVAAQSYALDVNEAGVVVGYLHELADNRRVPMKWVDGVGQRLPFPNEDIVGWTAGAHAINDRGDILGESMFDTGEQVFWFLAAGAAEPIALDDLLEPGFFESFDTFFAYGLNNSREMAGAAVRFDPASPFGSSNKPGVIRPQALDVAPFPAPGLWAEVARPGSGVEINRVDDHHYLVWYTYDEEGLPTWYFSDDVSLVRDGWRAELYEFSRDEDGEIVRQAVGHVLLSNRTRTSLHFTWRLHGSAGTADFDYLAGTCETGAVGQTGTWFDPTDAGYGVSIQEAADTLAGVFYFYDSNGVARWAYLDYPDGPGTAEAWIFSGGPCPACDHSTPFPTVAGSALLSLGEQSITLELDVAGSGNLEAISWQSANTMLRLSSAPQCGE